MLRGMCVCSVIMMTPLWSVVCVVCVAVSGVRGQQSVVVNTRYGALKGIRTVTGPQSHVDTFYNIPYAKPPTGALRFHKTVQNDAWLGLRDATRPGPMCPQKSFTANSSTTVVGQEDCLYLNVFTPKMPQDQGPLPVMVWIHGGAYYFNSGNDYNGTELASRGVIVVTVNYRLGVFGFLSTVDGAIPGNYGLWDQIRALQWVRDVISSFNGDPNDVTIFGESAGSSSVSLLILSMEARGLFHKAIMESGVSLCPWAVGYPRTDREANYRQQTVELASRLGCATTDSSHMLACLRTKDARAIVETIAEVEMGNLGLALRPVPETTFGQYGLFAAVPDVILRHGWFNNVTVIRGFNKNENGFGLDNLDPDNDGITMEEFKNVTRDFVKSFVIQVAKVDTQQIFDLLMETYVTTPGVTDPKQLLSVYMQIATDFSFIAPTNKEQAMYFNAGGNTEYMYQFSYRSANRLNKQWQGTVHGDELAYVFGSPLTNDSEWTEGFVSSWTDDDRLVSQQLMTLWTNFAKYGDPTPNDIIFSTRWLPWTQSTPRYLDIGVKATMISGTNTPAMHLWNDVIPNLGRIAENALVG